MQRIRNDTKRMYNLSIRGLPQHELASLLSEVVVVLVVRFVFLQRGHLMDGQSRHLVLHPLVLLYVASRVKQLGFGPDVVAVDADRDGLIVPKYDPDPIVLGQLDR